MKKLLLWLTVGLALFATTSCYDDSAINDRLDTQEQQLKDLTSKVNNLIEAMQILEDAQARGYFILSVDEITEDGDILGWTIRFSNGQTFTIYNGHDGIDGDSHELSIGDNGNWFIDGVDTGKSAKPAVTIGENGNWFVEGVDTGKPSTGKEPVITIGDNGNWFVDGVDTGKPSQAEGAITVSVEETEASWIITIGDKTFELPKATAVFAIKFAEVEFGAVAGQSITVPYTLQGVAEGDEVLVEAVAGGLWTASVNMAEGTVTAVAPTPYQDGKVIVFAANGRGGADMKVLYFAATSVVVDDSYQSEPASYEGGTVDVTVTSNVDFTVKIAQGATWLTYTGVKSKTSVLGFSIAANTGAARSARVDLMDSRNVSVQHFDIVQAGNPEVPEPEPTNGNTLKAVIADGEAAGFAWAGTEIISVQLVGNEGGNYDRWTFVNNGNTVSPIEFTGTGTTLFGPDETWSLANYIYYPFKNPSAGTFDLGRFQSAGENTANIEGVMKASVAAPGQAVPMIGVRGEGTSYTFHVATGFVQVTVTDCTEDLTGVRISAPAQQLSGTFTLSDDNGIKYLALAESSAATSMELQYTDATAETQVYAIPVPVGTLAAGYSIELMKGSTVLKSVTDGPELVITRGAVTDAGSISMEGTVVPQPGTVYMVTENGAKNPRIYWDMTAMTSGGIRLHISTSPTNDPTQYKAGNKFSMSLNPTSGFNLVGLLNEDSQSYLSASGKYYLHYIFASDMATEVTSLDDAIVLGYGSLPFYFLTDADEAAIAGKYSRTVAEGDVVSGAANAPETSQFTFAECPDATKGNIIMTGFDTWEEFTTPIPGAYNPSENSNQITFKNADLQVAFVEGRYLMNGSSPNTNSLIIEFNNEEKTELYMGAGMFGVTTTNVYPPEWYYVYNGLNTRIYTQVAE